MRFDCAGGCGAHLLWENDWWERKINTVICDHCLADFLAEAKRTPVVAPPPEPGTWEEFVADLKAMFAADRDGVYWRQAEALFAQKDAEIARLQAVAALMGENGRNFGYWDYIGTMWCCGCDKEQGQPHADGCPVGRYEEGQKGC